MMSLPLKRVRGWSNLFLIENPPANNTAEIGLHQVRGNPILVVAN